MQTLSARRSGSDPIGFVGCVWNPEDLAALPGTPWVVISGMRSRHRRGALFAVRCDHMETAVELVWSETAEQGRRGQAAFDPHGLSVRALSDRLFEVLVIDHGAGEAVDRLIVEVGDHPPRVVDGTRIQQPPGTSGNAVAHMPDGGFVLTSMFDPRDPDIPTKFAGGEVTGGVWHWDQAEGWRRFGTLDLSGANGIAASRDGSAVYVSEWAARRVWRLGPEGSPEAAVATRFLPDNLRWTADGRLLLAGQSARPEAVFGSDERGVQAPMAFEVAWLDPVAMRLRTFVAFDEDRARSAGFGAATGALEVEGRIWVGSFTGDRIAVFSNDPT